VEVGLSAGGREWGWLHSFQRGTLLFFLVLLDGLDRFLVHFSIFGTNPRTIIFSAMSSGTLTHRRAWPAFATLTLTVPGVALLICVVWYPISFRWISADLMAFTFDSYWDGEPPDRYLALCHGLNPFASHRSSSSSGAIAISLHAFAFSAQVRKKALDRRSSSFSSMSASPDLLKDFVRRPLCGFFGRVRYESADDALFRHDEMPFVSAFVCRLDGEHFSDSFY